MALKSKKTVNRSIILKTTKYILKITKYIL